MEIVDEKAGVDDADFTVALRHRTEYRNYAVRSSTVSIEGTRTMFGFQVELAIFGENNVDWPRACPGQLFYVYLG